ncbi:MAG: ABC transporter substrate-binding protein [Alphaproteobacteria bacterium]|nr:ABC transporter substrate-binding protein [Alphaproteobacteria bacterium]
MIRRSFIAAVAAVATLPFQAQAQGVSGSLLLYTSQPEKMAAETVTAFNAKHPGVKVELFRSGTTEVMNKLRTEIAAGAPQPDLIFIADAMTMEALKAEGRLLAFPDAPVAGLSPASYDKDRTYFGTKLITTGIVYNKKASFVPQTWADLLKPEAKNLVSLPSPLYSGAAAIHMGVLAMQPGIGMDFFKKLAANGAVRKSVADGEKMFGILVDFMAISEAQKGAPIGFVFPTDGVTAVTEPVAILKTAKNPAAAKAFVAFLLSEDGQRLAANQGMLPAHEKVSGPPGFPALSAIKVLNADIPAILKNDEANKKSFADLFGG